MPATFVTLFDGNTPLAVGKIPLQNAPNLTQVAGTIKGV